MQDLQPRRRESCNCWFLTQPTCNSWVLSSLGKESTKTCHPVEVLCKCQYSFSPLCPWQSWQPFVQITGCDLHLQGEAWKPQKGWQAGPCPGNPEMFTIYSILRNTGTWRIPMLLQKLSACELTASCNWVNLSAMSRVCNISYFPVAQYYVMRYFILFKKASFLAPRGPHNCWPTPYHNHQLIRVNLSVIGKY